MNSLTSLNVMFVWHSASVEAAAGSITMVVISAVYYFTLKDISCGASLRKLSEFRDIAMIRSIPHFSSPPRLKESRVDLPKKPVPPITKSVGI